MDTRADLILELKIEINKPWAIRCISGNAKYKSMIQQSGVTIACPVFK